MKRKVEVEEWGLGVRLKSKGEVVAVEGDGQSGKIGRVRLKGEVEIEG